ncbi:hypothetical protein WJX84_008718 [Apatococcus fuscideae]|uniref:Golgi apparatus protein 1 n=1 Tax=Apatococcus fuscideae TaxID=2026836 RepID=A0AAW1TCH5_9CHLO
MSEGSRRKQQHFKIACCVVLLCLAAPASGQQVVPQESAAKLANSDGDVATTGKCSSEIDAFCKDVTPGEGRLSKCLTDQFQEEMQDKYTGPRVSEACHNEVDGFKEDRASNINKDLPLARSCQHDVEKLCKDIRGDTNVLSCLRSKKEELSSECSDEVFERQLDAADDYRTDPALFKACEVDAKANCRAVDEHGGRVQQCLEEHEALLSWDCQEQLFRQQMENADDLRLSVRLFRKCLPDKKKFCKDVPPGNARAKECLEDHREDPGFQPECKEEIEKMMAARAADFRLDTQLRQLCAEDIRDICAYEADSLDMSAGMDARVSQCLQDYKEDIKSPACAKRVHKLIELASSDIRFDIPLADACHEDRVQFCGNTPPGSARVIRCLQDRREQLSTDCKATLFDQEVRMAESIDFQYKTKKACSPEIKRFCPGMPGGHARVIRCLQDHLSEAQFSTGCRSEVQRQQQNSATDYRLNFRLANACHTTIASKCSDACGAINLEQPCGGKVLRCLTDKLEEITDEECKKEVFYFEKMEVQDFRNDIMLAEACRKDVDSVCATIQPGEGRVHQCLRDNLEKLSDGCRKEELALRSAQSSNVELMPNLAQACAPERAKHCADVRSGKARVFMCLLNKSDRVEFTPACKKELTAQEERRVKDWRLDYDLRLACKEDVPKVCASAKADQDKENAAVFKCLVEKADSTGAACSQETGRAVRNALQFYAPRMPVTDICDSDVMDKCLQNKGLDTYGIGQIRQCLLHAGASDIAAADEARLVAESQGNTTRHHRRLQQASVPTELGEKEQALEKLSPGCKSLVLLAEPGDAYGAYQSLLSAGTVVGNMRKIESNFGLRAGTLTPVAATSGVSSLTITGWTATLGLLALIAVIIVGGIYGYRRSRSVSQNGTMPFQPVSEQEQSLGSRRREQEPQGGNAAAMPQAPQQIVAPTGSLCNVNKLDSTHAIQRDQPTGLHAHGVRVEVDDVAQEPIKERMISGKARALEICSSATACSHAAADVRR